MPVALKLSKEFYDRLGKEVANEFVDSLNAVDQSYRQEFRELFDANFRRIEGRMDGIEARLDAMEARIERMDGTVVHTDVFEARLGAFESRMDAKLAELKSELLRWMFLFWVGTMGTVLAIVKL